MTNPAKIKGSQFERDFADILNKLIKKSIWRRIAGSGAIGTIMNEPLLSSDVRGKVESFAQPFNVECKVGYNNSTGREVKQFTLKKEWLDKVALEASRTFGIPILAGKFLGAREGTKVFVAMDVEVFADLINRITELHEDLLKVRMEDVK
jgi:hypothetical protein